MGVQALAVAEHIHGAAAAAHIHEVGHTALMVGACIAVALAEVEHNRLLVHTAATVQVEHSHGVARVLVYIVVFLCGRNGLGVGEDNC